MPNLLPAARGAVTAGEQQLGICLAKQSKYYRLYLLSAKVALAVMCLREFE
jgi:hypothetical protein